jgi:hypothetical protein
MAQDINDYLNSLGNAIGELAHDVGGLYKVSEKLARSTENMYPMHLPGKFPIQNGTIEQNKNILSVLGEYENIISGKADRQGKYFNDEIEKFFLNEGVTGRILTGSADLDDTPVGKVTHPAPIDWTSVLYPVSLGARFAEEFYDFATKKNLHVSKDIKQLLEEADKLLLECNIASKTYVPPKTTPTQPTSLTKITPKTPGPSPAPQGGVSPSASAFNYNFGYNAQNYCPNTPIYTSNTSKKRSGGKKTTKRTTAKKAGSDDHSNKAIAVSHGNEVNNYIGFEKYGKSTPKELEKADKTTGVV